MIGKFLIINTFLFVLTASAHELVLNHDFPDPTVIKANDGYYYAYATQGMTEDASPRILNLQMARSKDLKTWKHLGEALPEKPSWAKTTQAFWAPHIHFAQNKYYLYYSADPDTRNGLCLAVAVSSKPQGPFVDSGKPLICGPSFSNIDPMTYLEEKSGKTLMYWGSGFDPIRVRELDESLVNFKAGTTTLNLIAPDTSAEPAPYTRLLEGAWILKRDDYYYLFVSGENCCSGPDPKYAVLVLRSKSLKGPFEWRDNDPRKSVVIQSAGRFSATGHNAFITDNQGQLWTLYHGVDEKKPLLQHPIPGDRSNRRVLLKRKVLFQEGWPLTK